MMRKGREELVVSSHNRTIGNHSVEYVNDKFRVFKYFGNKVCYVDDDNKKFALDDCGYSKYSSTTATLNDYKYWFGSYKGYELVRKEDMYA